MVRFIMTQILHPGSPNLLLTSLVGWFVVVNLLAFLGFFLDQRRALTDQGAMPVVPLLLLSTLGGWPGAQLGRLCFQNQQRERGFLIFLNVSILPVLAFAAMLGAQDVDWAGLAGKVQQMIAAQTAAPAEEAVAATEPANPAVSKPEVTSIAKTSATKETSVTDKPDLPKRIGPSSKKEAWQSR